MRFGPCAHGDALLVGWSGMGTMWGCGWNLYILHTMTALGWPHPAWNAADLHCRERDSCPCKKCVLRGELIWLASGWPVRGGPMDPNSAAEASPSLGCDERGCWAAHLLHPAQSPSSPCLPLCTSLLVGSFQNTPIPVQNAAGSCAAPSPRLC